MFEKSISQKYMFWNVLERQKDFPAPGYFQMLGEKKNI